MLHLHHGGAVPAARVFARNELVPLQAQFEAINVGRRGSGALRPV
ncbi:hypothetical protein [Janthinobacterium sp. 78]|nr:hypothetical protein [Janthinobacterium sp. 78]